MNGPNEERYSANLERLLAISREITLTTDLKTLYRAIVRASEDLLCLDFSTLMLLSKDKTTLTVHDCVGFPEAMIGRFSLTENQGLSTLVIRKKKPEIVTDFTNETRFEVPHLVWEKKIRSAIAVPMMMQDDILGVLIGHTLDARAFSAEDISLYQNIGNQAAVAIKNAMLIADLQKALSEIKTLQGVLPICSYCKRIRDDEGAWQKLELYISKRTDADFSHGLCEECAKKHYPRHFNGDAHPTAE